MYIFLACFSQHRYLSHLKTTGIAVLEEMKLTLISQRRGRRKLETKLLFNLSVLQ